MYSAGSQDTSNVQATISNVNSELAAGNNQVVIKKVMDIENEFISPDEVLYMSTDLSLQRNSPKIPSSEILNNSSRILNTTVQSDQLQQLLKINKNPPIHANTLRYSLGKSMENDKISNTKDNTSYKPSLSPIVERNTDSAQGGTPQCSSISLSEMTADSSQNLISQYSNVGITKTGNVLHSEGVMIHSDVNVMGVNNHPMSDLPKDSSNFNGETQVDDWIDADPPMNMIPRNNAGKEIVTDILRTNIVQDDLCVNDKYEVENVRRSPKESVKEIAVTSISAQAAALEEKEKSLVEWEQRLILMEKELQRQVAQSKQQNETPSLLSKPSTPSSSNHGNDPVHCARTPTIRSLSAVKEGAQKVLHIANITEEIADEEKGPGSTKKDVVKTGIWSQLIHNSQGKVEEEDSGAWGTSALLVGGSRGSGGLLRRYNRRLMKKNSPSNASPRTETVPLARGLVSDGGGFGGLAISADIRNESVQKDSVAVVDAYHFNTGDTPPEETGKTTTTATEGPPLHKGNTHTRPETILSDMDNDKLNEVQYQMNSIVENINNTSHSSEQLNETRSKEQHQAKPRELTDPVSSEDSLSRSKTATTEKLVVENIAPRNIPINLNNNMINTDGITRPVITSVQSECVAEEAEWESQEKILQNTGTRTKPVSVSASKSRLTNNSRFSAGNEDLESYPLAKSSLPLSLLEINEISKKYWVIIWDILVKAGWTWKKGMNVFYIIFIHFRLCELMSSIYLFLCIHSGKKLIDFYYVPPNGNVNEGAEGEDYFIDPKDVLDYVKKWLGVRVLEDGSFTSPVKKKLQLDGTKEANSAIVTLRGKDDLQDKGMIDQAIQMNQNGEKLPPNDLLPSNNIHGSMGSNTEPNMTSSNVVLATSLKAPSEWWRSIEELTWPVIWSYLQKEGWSWDFGSGLITTWYILPGYNKNTAVAGATKLSSTEEVIEYVKNKYGFKKIEKNNSNDCIMNNTNNSILNDDNWSLVKNRKRRRSPPTSIADYSNMMNISDENFNDDCQQIRKLSKKKPKPSGAQSANSFLQKKKLQSIRKSNQQQRNICPEDLQLPNIYNVAVDDDQVNYFQSLSEFLNCNISQSSIILQYIIMNSFQPLIVTLGLPVTCP